MAFDKTAWDPTPSQLSTFAVIVSWIAAYLLERFFLRETNVSECLHSVFSALTGNGSLKVIWPPIFLGCVVPFLVILGVMFFDRKNLRFKRGVLSVGIIGLTVFLVMFDLKFRFF